MGAKGGDVAGEKDGGSLGGVAGGREDCRMHRRTIVVAGSEGVGGAVVVAGSRNSEVILADFRDSEVILADFRDVCRGHRRQASGRIWQ